MAAVAAAPPMPPHMLRGPVPHRRQHADDLMIDMNRLMEAVREEVTALMLEGVHKTASLCASTCAQHVVAARREMHQRLRGKNGGMTPNSMPTPTNSTGFLGLTPRHDRALLPRVAAAETRVVPPPAPNMPCPIPIYTPVTNGRDIQSDASVFPFMAAAAHSTSQMTPTPQMTPSTNGVFQDSLDSSTAYDTLVDTRDAVHNLEAQTRMASRAMELIEEAIKVATDVADVAGTSQVAGQHCREVLQADAQTNGGFATPRGGTPRGRSMVPEVQQDSAAAVEVVHDTKLSEHTHSPGPCSIREGRGDSPQPAQGTSAKHVRGLSPGGLAVTTHKVEAAPADLDKLDDSAAPAQDGHGSNPFAASSAAQVAAPPAPVRLAPLPQNNHEAADVAASSADISNGYHDAHSSPEPADTAFWNREHEHGKAQRRERSTASFCSSAESIPAMDLTGS